MENKPEGAIRRQPISKSESEPISSYVDSLLAKAKQLEATQRKLLRQLDQVIKASAACLEQYQSNARRKA